MIFLIEFKLHEKPKFFEKAVIIEEGEWKFVEDGKNIYLLSWDGEWLYRTDIILNDIYHPLMKINEKGHKGDKMITIWRNKYNKDEEIIEVNGICVAIRCRTEIDVRNLIFGIKNEYLYVINWLIRSRRNRRLDRDAMLYSVAPTNSVVSLASVDQVRGLGKWFVTTKIDGVTSVIAWLKDYNRIVGFELIGGVAQLNSKKIIDIEIDISRNNDVAFGNTISERNDVVFLGEWTGSHVYLFLEANDQTGDFRVDYANMKRFVQDVNNDMIRMNNIYIAKSNEGRRDLMKKIIPMSGGPDTGEGYVFGNISTKHHLKWKPPHLNTIDFYVIIREKSSLYLYAADHIGNAKKRMRGEYIKLLRRQEGKSRIPVNLIIGRKGYVKQLWAIQKRTIDFDPDWREKFNERIVECQYLNNQWIPYRVRPDKVNPQNWRWANAIWETIKNPIRMNELLL